VGFLAGASEPDVGPFPGCVLGDDQVGGVGGVALGGERVLDVGEAQVRARGLRGVEGDLSSGWKPEFELARVLSSSIPVICAMVPLRS